MKKKYWIETTERTRTDSIKEKANSAKRKYVVPSKNFSKMNLEVT